MKPNSTTPVLDLALEFTKLLQAQLSTDVLNTVRKLNALEQDSDICHTHNFCDANQVMIDALDELHETFDPQDAAQGNWIDAAWSLAKLAGFREDIIRSLADVMGVDQ